MAHSSSLPRGCLGQERQSARRRRKGAAVKRAGGSRLLRIRQKPGGLRRFRRGREDRLLVGLQDRKPCREILRVILARYVGDAEIGAQERGSEFCDKLLHGVGLVAKALAELAIAAGRRA